MIILSTRADHERAYWDGFRYSLSFGLVPEDTMARDYGDFYETTGDSVDSAFWMGWAAGNIVASGTYAAITTPVGLGMGSVISHSGFIAWEAMKNLTMPIALLPPVLVVGAAAVLAEAGLTLGLGDYRNRMADHKTYYHPMTQRRMR